MHGPGTLKEQSDSTKWGMSREQTVEIVKRAQKMPNIRLKETHFHLSRMTNDPRDFAVMAREMITWSGYLRDQRRLDAALHRHRRRLDLRQIVRHRARTASSTMPRRRRADDYAELCSAAIKDEAPKLGLPLPKLRLEPGRSLSGPSGVSRRPRRRGQAGREEEVGQSRSLDQPPVLGRRARLVLSRRAGGECRRRTARETVDLVGPLCNSDEVGPHRKMPPLKRGDSSPSSTPAATPNPAPRATTRNCCRRPFWCAAISADITTEREQLKDIAGRFRVPPRLLRSFAPRLRVAPLTRAGSAPMEAR